MTTTVRAIELMLPGSFGKETLSNDGMQNLALGISGAATIALTNTDHTLTTDNQGEAQHFVQILTGALTANVNVIVPAESRVYVADNRTTGAFTVTMKTASGGGVAVDQGVRTLVYCDGTTVYPVASGTGGGGGSGAPTDATYLVQSPHALLTGERAVMNTPTVVWDFATPGAAGATIPDGAISYAKVQDVTPTRLLGRFAAGSGDVQEITPGTGLTLDATGVLSATAVGQPLDATLTALAGLATGANQVPYFTGTDTAAQTPLTAFARTVLDDADQAAMQATLGVVPGTTVQPLDATLTALAGVTTGVNMLPFFTGTDTASTTVLTAFMRSLLDDPDQATAQATLGVTGSGGSYTDEQAQDAVGSILLDSATLDFTYDDATPSLTGIVKDASIGEAKLLLADVTTHNVSTTQHGLVPKATGVATHYLDGTGAWSTPAGGGAGGTVVGAMVTRTAFTSGPTGTNIAISWNTEVRDDANFWASTPNPTRLTTSTAGWYTVTASINWDNPTTGGRFLYVRLNGSTIIAEQATNGMADLRQNIAVTRYFAASDYVEIVFFQNSGGTVDLDSAMASIISEFGAGAPATTFLLLTDTPDTYSGQGGNLVTVNAGATALDFTPLTAAGRALLDDADAAAQRETLGLGTMATQNASAVAITGGSAGGLSSLGVNGVSTTLNNTVLDRTGDNVSALFTTINATGGSNRWSLLLNGDAASYVGGSLVVAATKGILLGTGSPTPFAGGKLEVTYNRASESAIAVKPSADTGAGNAGAFFNAAGGFVGSISTTGSATAYNTSSDARLKHAVTTLAGALARVRALRPISHRWNVDDSPGVGFLAHELMAVIPEAVTGEPDAVDAEGRIVPQQIDHSRLVPWLCGAIQELAARVQALETALGV